MLAQVRLAATRRLCNITQDKTLTSAFFYCFSLRYPRNLRQIFNQKRSYLPAKIHFFKFFLTAFIVTA
jgi:hypothetical protein